MPCSRNGLGRRLLMRKNRVLHVYKYFRPQFTGEGVFLERLAPVFVRLRPDLIHEVAVTVTPPPASAGNLCAGIQAIHYLNERGNPDGTSALSQIAWLLRHAHRYRTIHYHTHVDWYLASYVLAKVLWCRLILSSTLDDSASALLNSYSPFLRPLVRAVLQLFDGFVTISPKLMAETAAEMGACKTHIIPMGIPIPSMTDGERERARSRLSLDPRAPVLLCVGGICPRKDQLFLIRQLPQLLRFAPSLLLVLVGPVLDESYKATIEAFIRQNSLETHVRLDGYQDSPWDYYNAADAMVFASREEGFGTVQIEAMAFGLPLIARYLKGVNDAFIEHEKTGFLFTDEATFQRYLVSLLESEQLRREVGAQARAFVEARFDIETIAARYLAFY
jgi:glycosyltransferase involved in cell wall biosynthesis